MERFKKFNFQEYVLFEKHKSLFIDRHNAIIIFHDIQYNTTYNEFIFNPMRPTLTCIFSENVQPGKLFL